MDIAARIKELRKKTGLSQSKFSAKFGMHIAGANGHFCGLQRTRSVVTGQVRSSPILNRLIACYFNS